MSSKEKVFPHKGITRIQCICCPKIFKSHLTFLKHLTDTHKKFNKTNKLKIITNKHFKPTHTIESTEDHIESPYIFFIPNIFNTHGAFDTYKNSITPKNKISWVEKKSAPSNNKKQKEILPRDSFLTESVVFCNFRGIYNGIYTCPFSCLSKQYQNNKPIYTKEYLHHNHITISKSQRLIR